LDKQKKLIQVASMKSAEHLLDGPVDKRSGSKDKTGKKRGPYGIGGCWIGQHRGRGEKSTRVMWQGCPKLWKQKSNTN